MSYQTKNSLIKNVTLTYAANAANVQKDIPVSAGVRWVIADIEFQNKDSGLTINSLYIDNTPLYLDYNNIKFNLSDIFHEGAIVDSALTVEASESSGAQQSIDIIIRGHTLR